MEIKNAFGFHFPHLAHFPPLAPADFSSNHGNKRHPTPPSAMPTMDTAFPSLSFPPCPQKPTLPLSFSPSVTPVSLTPTKEWLVRRRHPQAPTPSTPATRCLAISWSNNPSLAPTSKRHRYGHDYPSPPPTTIGDIKTSQIFTCFFFFFFFRFEVLSFLGIFFFFNREIGYFYG